MEKLFQEWLSRDVCGVIVGFMSRFDLWVQGRFPLDNATSMAVDEDRGRIFVVSYRVRKSQEGNRLHDAITELTTDFKPCLDSRVVILSQTSSLGNMNLLCFSDHRLFVSLYVKNGGIDVYDTNSGCSDSGCSNSGCSNTFQRIKTIPRSSIVYGMAVANGLLYTATYQCNQVQVSTVNDDTHVFRFGDFTTPRGILVLGLFIYVADMSTAMIYCFNLKGEFQHYFEHLSMKTPWIMTARADYLYVVSMGGQEPIHVFRLSDRSFVKEINYNAFGIATLGHRTIASMGSGLRIID